MKNLFESLIELYTALREKKLREYNRSLPFGDYIVDRWQKAKDLGFGEGTSVYDNVVIIGDVKVGKNTWIGPNVVLDGSGGLVIGDNCSISAGVQIYTHDSVNWAVSGGTAPYDYSGTKIGNNCYIGPNSVIAKGVILGDCCIVGTNSLVKSSFPTKSKIAGNPAKILN